MWTMVQTGPEAGDCTAPYRLEFDKKYTVKEFVDLVISDKNEWGTIGIFSAEKTLINVLTGTPYIEYRYGLLLSEFEPVILNKIITSATAHGGWTRMDYILTLEKGEESMSTTNENKKTIDINIEKEPSDKQRLFRWLDKLIPDDIKLGHFSMTFEEDGSAVIHLKNREVE